MSDPTKIVKIKLDPFLPCVVILVIFCAGDPDLLDALIYWLMH